VGNIQISARIPPELYEKLVTKAQILKVPKSEVLFAALVQYLNQTEELPIDRKLAQLEKRVTVLESQSKQLNSSTRINKISTEITFPPLKILEFETVSINVKGEIIDRILTTNQYFSEELDDGISLKMIAIPEGNFWMGASEIAKESRETEKPQHQVAIASFFFSQFPITQAQWKAVANLPKVQRYLDPNPSYFQGDDRPVERISWYDATEFCQRLSHHTGRCYRLPSEAEWEYACRGGTTTPFYFGETITGELANYVAGRIYRQETTVVGSFPPNAFGLHDLHGNVWEWCSDRWHNNYDGAPLNGDPWLLEDYENEIAPRVLRGGAWDFYPEFCRSSSRFSCPPTAALINQIGLRIVCDPTANLPPPTS
jgi:formylglycine-generating enzyme required for sulfatase activity